MTKHSPSTPSKTSLLSIQRANRRHIPHLNPTPLLPIRIKKRRLQPTLTLRHSQPQPHQMPPNPFPPALVQTPRRPVLISSPRMQHVPISQQLDIARLQNHMQRQLRRRVLQHAQSVELLLAQRRDGGVWTAVEARERGEVVGVEFVPYP